MDIIEKKLTKELEFYEQQVEEYTTKVEQAQKLLAFYKQK